MPQNHDDELARLRARLEAAEQRATKLAQASAALQGTLDSLHTPDDLEALLGHTLKSIADQIGVRSASAWIFDPDLVAHLVWTIEDDQIVRGAGSSHANANKPSLPNAWHEQWLRGMGRPSPNVLPVADHPGMTPEQRQFLLGRGVKALVSVPVVLGKQLVGSFTLHVRSETYPLAEDLELIQALANQASFAFHVTRLAQVARDAAIVGERERAAEQRCNRLAQANAALRGTLTSIRTADDVDGVLGQTLDLLVQHLGARMGAAYLADGEQALHLVWCTTGGQRVRGAESTHPATGKPIARALYERWLRDRGYAEVPHVFVFEDPGQDADEKRWMRSLGVTTTVSLPMLLGDEMVGSFTLGIDSSSPSREDLELVQGLANRFAFAAHLGRLAREARDAEAHAVRAAAVTEERNRLAREIHDTIAQGLAAIIRQLEGARTTSAPDVAAKHLSIATDIARESLVEARRSIRALRPVSLEGHTLEGALRELVQRCARLASSEIRMQSTGAPASLPGDVEGELFRIVNEAVTNAIKHASARSIVVELSSDESSVRIGVRDDGVGFDPATVRHGVGSGSMRERAERIGAVVTVATEPGTGTEVLVYWTRPAA